MAKPKNVSKTTDSTQNSFGLPGGKLNKFLNLNIDKLTNFKSSKKLYIIILIAGLLLLAFYKKSLFIAASVNGMPLTNLELQLKLNQQFRNQLLNQLINEKIILEEARKANAIPTGAGIDKKITDLETSVGGAQTLDSLLTQQGQTRVNLRNQVRIQLAISKLYETEATVSATEVTKYIEQNKTTMQATDSAKQQQEAYDSLKQQKISQIFSQKFQELRQKAKIQIF